MTLFDRLTPLLEVLYKDQVKARAQKGQILELINFDQNGVNFDHFFSQYLIYWYHLFLLSCNV